MTDISQSGASWFLRTADGATYGPVALAVLREWADQARVGPGTAVSTDREAWIPPERLPELGLNWMVELPDETLYGPLTTRAVAELVRDGVIAIGSRALNTHTKQGHPVQDLIAQPAQEFPSAAEVMKAEPAPVPAGAGEEKAAGSDAPRQPDAALIREVEALRHEARAARDEAEKVRQSLDGERAVYARELAARDVRIAELVQRVGETEQRLSEQADATEAARRAGADRERGWIEAKAQWEREREGLDTSLGELRREGAGLQARLQRTAVELESTGGAIAHERDYLSEREAALRREVEELRGQVASLEQASVAALRTISEREEQYNQLRLQSEKVAAELTRRIEGLDVEKHTAFQELDLFRDEVARGKSVGMEALRRREEREKELSQQVELLHGEVSRLSDLLDAAKRDVAQRENQWQIQKDDSARDAELHRQQTDALDREKRDLAARQQHAMEMLEREKEARARETTEHDERVREANLLIDERSREVRRVADACAVAGRQLTDMEEEHRVAQERRDQEVQALGQQIERLTQDHQQAALRARELADELGTSRRDHAQEIACRDEREKDMDKWIRHMETEARSGDAALQELRRELLDVRRSQRTALAGEKQKEKTYRHHIRRLYKEQLAMAARLKRAEERSRIGAPAAPSPAPAVGPMKVDWIDVESPQPRGRPGTAEQPVVAPALFKQIEELERELQKTVESLDETQLELEAEREIHGVAAPGENEASGAQLTPLAEEGQIIGASETTAEPGKVIDVESYEGPTEASSEPPRLAPKRVLVNLEAQAREDLANWQRIKEQTSKPRIRIRNWLFRKDGS